MLLTKEINQHIIEIYQQEWRGEKMKFTKIPEINITDNTLDNIIKMAPYLDEGSQRTVFGMMLEVVMSMKDDNKKAG